MRRLVIAVLIALALGCESRTVYVGGPILTVDAEDRVVEALGVDGERIGAVGSEAEVRAWAGDTARIVDLEGRALAPGFIDAHGHFAGEGLAVLVVDLNSPPIGEVTRMDELVERLARKAAETAKGEWIVGMGYDDTLLTELRHPTRADLDRASSEHPVAIMHISGHLASVNSRALAELGLDRDSPDPEGGLMQRDASTGELTGVLEENAIEPLQPLLVPDSVGDILRLVREGVARYVAAGVTTAQTGHAFMEEMRGYPWLSRLGVIPIRLVLWPSMYALDAALEADEPFATYDEDWVRIGAVKLVADGSIQGYTGYLGEPYHVPPGDDPGYRGYPRIPRDELLERARRYHEAGWQLAIHANGDASIDDTLDAFEHAFAARPAADARPVIIHSQMARDDQLGRMRELGAIPSFFSLHTYYWGDRHRERFMGPSRAARMSPAQSAIGRGVRFTIHCDSPVVPMEPLRLMWAAVNRRSSSGAVIGAEERISAAQALRAVTIDAAHQHFEEQLKGSLEPGKFADLVILSASPLDQPETIDEIRVVETIVGGRSVFRARGT